MVSVYGIIALHTAANQRSTSRPSEKTQQMDNISPAHIDPKELDLPDGFTSANPNATGGGSAGGGKSEAQEKEEQKQAILQQALTPDALARLRRIKVLYAADEAHLSERIIRKSALTSSVFFNLLALSSSKPTKPRQ